MAKIVKNDKGFKVIECTSRELSLGDYGICDNCSNLNTNGYYVAVLNLWLCETCYNKWISTAIPHEDDEKYEDRNFKYYCKLLEVKNENII